MRANGLLYLIMLAYIAGVMNLNAITPLQEKNRVKIMSYNVHNAIGLDHISNTRRIADVINRSGADIVALQELDSATVRSGGRYILGEIAEETLMRPVFAGAIDFQGGRYGVGILCRERPLSVRRIPLPGSEEPRVLLLVEFERYLFACTHLSLTEKDRLKSVEILERETAGFSKPVFLAGDLNDVPGSEMHGELMKSFTALTRGKSMTFPADNPDRTLDYIMMRSGDNSVAAIGSGVVEETVASDHRPVIATVQFKTRRNDIIYRKPYLQNPGSDAITVMFQTNVMAHAWLEIGTDTLDMERVRTLSAGQAICHDVEHKIGLDRLTPGTRYYYRACANEILDYRSYRKVLGDTAVTPFYSFVLPETKAKDVTVLVLNDLHDNLRTIESMSRLCSGIPHDMVILNGDCLPEPDSREDALSRLHDLNEAFGGSSKPIVHIRGNHEIRNAYSAGMPSLFDNPGGKTYGAFSWGDTRFVILDCGEDKPDDHWVYYGLNDFSRLRAEQSDWLKSEIACSEFLNSKRRILLHHVPVWGNTDEYRPCTNLWAPILKDAGFDIDLTAHTHEYRFHPEGSCDANPMPVVVGGGPKIDEATMIVLERHGDDVTVRVLDALGNELKCVRL